MRYVAIGPMKGKTFKIAAGLVVVDGAVEVPEAIHRSYGHVLRADWGVLPESEVPAESVTQPPPAEPDAAPLEYPVPVIRTETADVTPPKRRK